MAYIDFHTHILPGIDDGATNAEESVKMLKTAFSNGAETLLLTPHYMSEEPIADFCKRRDESYSLLKVAMKEAGGEFPNLRIGAEVAMDCTLSELEDLERLCIEGTDLILLELPYQSWNKWHIHEVYNMIAKRNLTPVMAHIERYLKSPKELAKLQQLISIGAKFQINASSFLTFSGKRIIREMERADLISAIGSDCHDLTSRSPDISRAIHSMEKHLGTPILSDVFNTSKQLLCL